MPGPAPVPPAGVLAPTTRDRADATPDMVRRLQEVEGEFHTEAYSRIVENAFHSVHEHPLSTFSIDVDTASYANVRRYLTGSMLPPPDAVRLEEMVNYFTYDYAPPSDKAHPFAVHMEVAACPWKSGHKLLRVGLKGRELDLDHRPPSNLVFLLDVSGSMNEPNKLPLLKSGIQLLVNQLGENDRVAIVVYAGASGLVLPSTTGDKKQEILAAIERLHAGGSTNGGAGIQLAYEVAREHFLQGGTNRVILATDGDFNVGVTSQGELVRTIEDKAKSGVFLSVLGFGMGNYKDDTLEKLADKGNGNYAYVDSLREARKVLVEQMAGTLVTIAKDVKIQIEFNPAQVSSYRLIGYENRILAKEDFNDDKKDAGEIGAGHTVTALYELVTAGGAAPEGGAPAVDPLKYQQAPAASPAAGASGELCTVKLRYKQPEGDASTLMTYPLRGAGGEFDKASTDFRFAAAVAGYGMLLRRSEFAAGFSWDAVVEIAGSSLGADREGYRKEFLDLARKAKALASQK
ncbi:MAG: VWA domain-containing protein [Planctomycetes bacterium]|nr:VWA domain-containing protein [Planctomycetota bacterium]